MTARKLIRGHPCILYVTSIVALTNDSRADAALNRVGASPHGRDRAHAARFRPARPRGATARAQQADTQQRRPPPAARAPLPPSDAPAADPPARARAP